MDGLMFPKKKYKKKREVWKGRTTSILQGKAKECYVTGEVEDLHKHHIFYGEGMRDISDRHGFWVYLADRVHIAGLGGLHAHPGKGLDLELKQACQRKFEENHSRQEWMDIIGRNYL